MKRRDWLKRALLGTASVLGITRAAEVVASTTKVVVTYTWKRIYSQSITPENSNFTCLVTKWELTDEMGQPRIGGKLGLVEIDPESLVGLPPGVQRMNEILLGLPSGVQRMNEILQGDDKEVVTEVIDVGGLPLSVSFMQAKKKND